MAASRLLYYSSLIPVYQSLSLYLGAVLPFLFLTRATSICHCRCILCVFLWSLLLCTSVNFCPLSALCLCCAVSQGCLLMFLLLKAWTTENSSLATFKQITHISLQNITTVIKYFTISHCVLICPFFRLQNGILWFELFFFFCIIIHCIHNKLMGFGSVLL